MELLSTVEQILLLAVWELGEDAYGVAIRNHIEESAGRSLSAGAIYAPLERLTASGLLSSSMGEPTAERGGRAKRFYSITAQGVTALRETRNVTESMWSRIGNQGVSMGSRTWGVMAE